MVYLRQDTYASLSIIRPIFNKVILYPTFAKYKIAMFRYKITYNNLTHNVRKIFSNKRYLSKYLGIFYQNAKSIIWTMLKVNFEHSMNHNKL